MPLPRAFWRLAAATGVSNLSDGLVSVVMPLVALQLTGSPVVVAVVAAATRLPWLLFALVAGAIIDRVDRRTLMVRAQVFRGVGLAVLAAVLLHGTTPVAALVVVALLLGMAEVLYDSSSQTILPSVVPKASLPVANSRLFGVEATANTFVGPPLAGLLVAVAAPVAIAVGSLAYLLAAVLVRTLPGSFRARGASARAWHRAEVGASTRRGPARWVWSAWPSGRTAKDIREGLVHLFADRVLRRLTVLVAVSSFTMAAVSVILPVHVVGPGPMGLSEAGYGLLVASSGIGAVLASLTSERVLRLMPPGVTLRAAIVVVATMQCLLLSTAPVLVGAALATMSFFIVLWNVVTISYRQASVPDHLLGRVNSAYRMCAWGSGPLGALAGGLLTSATSTSTAFVAAGVATGLMVPVVWRLRRIVLPEA